MIGNDIESAAENTAQIVKVARRGKYKDLKELSYRTQRAIIKINLQINDTRKQTTDGGGHRILSGRNYRMD